MSIGRFQKTQNEMIYFLEVVRQLKSCKFCKNCSIHGKNCEICVPYNFWTPVKSNIPDDDVMKNVNNFQIAKVQPQGIA